MKPSDHQEQIVISVCAGTGGLAAGGAQVLASFKSALEATEKKALVEHRCRKVGCRGFCAKDVLVDVDIDGQVSTNSSRLKRPCGLSTNT
jgi:NADH-quinone oxidoreductase subunit F